MSETKKKPAHYVSNKKFYEALVEYKAAIAAAQEAGEPKPQIPKYVGECLMMIAQRLSNKPNFIGYAYKEEMIADGIENCIRYLDLFKPERSNNPFAYFTQTIKMAFVRRIKKEKRQLYLKMKATQNYQLTAQLNDPMFIPEDNDVVNSFIKDYEESIVKKKQKQGLEKAIIEDDTEETTTPNN